MVYGGFCKVCNDHLVTYMILSLTLMREKISIVVLFNYVICRLKLTLIASCVHYLWPGWKKCRGISQIILWQTRVQIRENIWWNRTQSLTHLLFMEIYVCLTGPTECLRKSGTLIFFNKQACQILTQIDLLSLWSCW